MSTPLHLMTESDVLSALRMRFPAPAWCMMAGVANGTGSHARRWSDAVAMSIWPSRGLELHGFEIKVDRRDVLRELKNPAKADEVAKYLDRWWLAVGSASIVKEEEVPAAWGLLVPTRSRAGVTMKIVKDAKSLKPKPISRGFLAAILRRVAERHDPDRIRAQFERQLRVEVRDSIHASIKADYEHQLEVLRQRENAARKAADDASAALRALSEQPLAVPSIIKAVHLLHKLGGWRGAVPALERLEQTLDRDRSTLAEIIETLQETRSLIEDLNPNDKGTTP